jgi:hypothetical protein
VAAFALGIPDQINRMQRPYFCPRDDASHAIGAAAARVGSVMRVRRHLGGER